MNTDACLCSHDQDRHGRNTAGLHTGRCFVPLCGCGSFRPRPPVADEAERWLAARFPDKDEGAA